MATYENYRLLIEKLDQFIRKYYVNQLLRGILYSVGLILVLFITINVLEYFFYFSTTGRKLLLFSFLGTTILALGGWVVLPLLKYFHLGKVISHERAASIIGNHFQDVKDKLLNILQLKQQADHLGQQELILAGIDQKSEEIKLVPFKSAINLSQNRKYLRYALPPLLLLLVILFAAPSVIRDSTERLIYNGKEFLRPAPFSFIIPEDSLSVVQYADFPLTVEVEGAQLPNEVFIEVDDYQYRLTKEAPNRFTYRFSNVQKDQRFRLTSAGVNSLPYTLKVLRKPNIQRFEVKLDYPAYIGRKDESLDNIGDLVVPVGTQIDWVFNATYTDAVKLAFTRDNNRQAAKRFSDDLFTFRKKAMQDDTYRVFISNQAIPQGDSVTYTLTIVPDLYPEIAAERFIDSTESKVLFFAGEASDDYGLRSLTFNYRIRRAGGGSPGELQTTLLRRPDNKEVQFEHIFDLRELGLKPGDEVSYYFEVFDNDGVNGSKSARTGVMVFALPTAEEFKQMEADNNDKIKDNLLKAMQESRKVQNQMKKLREKLLQEKEMDWQSRKELEKLLDRQKELEKQIEEAKQAFEENRKNQEEFSEQQQDILDKQEKLQELFDETMSEEMQELMKQIEELLQEMDKDQALEKMEQMEMNDSEMQMELDRLLELFKQLELEKEMRETLDQLEKLAEQQEKLSEETKQNQQDQQNQSPQQQQKQQEKQKDLQEKQDDINKEFDKIQEKMDDLEKKNEELEKPKQLDTQEEQQQDIQRDLNDSKQQLQQNKNSKASQSQKNASQKMKNMANSMKMQMQAGQMQQMQMDMQSLRQLLENLVGLSFDQEDLIKELEKTEINTPRYITLTQQQFKIKDDFKIAEDSLQALAKRVFQIESFVTEKVTEIKGNIQKSLGDLEDRRKFQAADHQQRTMKNLNDLALMLSEVMNQMQQQMSAMMSGSQMCSKPGQGQQGNVPQDKISEGQEQLNQEMKGKQGQQQKSGEGPSSKEFAQMAAKQAALRRAMEERQRKLQEQGKGSKELQDLIDQMNKSEIDLVNKRLTNEMMKRQQDIMVRLLEYEKAERQQKEDEKRKSETGRDYARKMPPALEEYIRQRRAQVEQFKTVSPALKPYYKNLVEEYFKAIKGNSGN